MFFRLLSIENTKLFRRMIIWVELFLFTGMAAGAFLLIGLSNPISPIVLLPEALNHSRVLDLTTGYGLGGLFFVVLAASMASEYSWGTINLLLSRAAPRPLLLVAKFLVLLVPGFLITLLPQVGSAIISVFFTLAQHGWLAAASQVDWGYVGESILLATVTLLPYGALAFFLAILTRSTIFSIGLAGGFGLLGENILVRILGFLGKDYLQIFFYLPSGLARGLLTAIRPPEIAGFFTPILSAVGILLYCLAFLGAAIWIFRRQDLSSGT